MHRWRRPAAPAAGRRPAQPRTSAPELRRAAMRSACALRAPGSRPSQSHPPVHVRPLSLAPGQWRQAIFRMDGIWPVVVVGDQEPDSAVNPRIGVSAGFLNRKSRRQFAVQFAAIAWSCRLTSLRSGAACGRLVRSSRSPQHGGRNLMGNIAVCLITQLAATGPAGACLRAGPFWRRSRALGRSAPSAAGRPASGQAIYVAETHDGGRSVRSAAVPSLVQGHGGDTAGFTSGGPGGD